MTERTTLTAPPAMRAAMARRAVPPPEPKPAPPLPAAPEPEPKPNFVGSSDKVKAARQPPRTDKGVRRHETNLRVHALLAERFPAAFSRPRPLAVGIYKAIRAAVSRDELSSRALSAFLAGWTHRKPYRAALERGDRRIGLDGQDAGPAFDDSQNEKQAAQ